MIQLLRIVVVIAILATGVQRSNAQSLSTASSSQGPLEEAAQLNQVVLRLSGEGKYGEAIAPAERALALLEKALRPNHPNVADSLNVLAGVYKAQGAYTKAERLLVRALDIREKTLGPNHPIVATNLNDLAALYWVHGAYTQAEPLLARAADIAEQLLRTELERLSESRKRALMALLQGDTERLISFQADTTPSSARALELALTTILRRKRRIVDSLADNQTRLRAHLTPTLQQQLDQLSQMRSELVGRIYAPAGPPAAAAAHRDEIASLRARMDELLRRALVVAGAASQVVSLWSVADASTPALMRDYYAALQQGTGLAEALRQAKRHLLQQPGSAHPFYWAAFIPAGDWRPLDATAFLPQSSTP